MRHPCVMHTRPLTPPDTVSHEQSWVLANERALACAHEHEWEAAAELWSLALADAPAFALQPDTHALLLSNLAQARFQCGELELAVELGQRSIAARLLSCDGERDAPMARAQCDLAVYLTAVARLDEAASMLDDARESLEVQYGDEDPRLVCVLENQARLALMTNNSAVAEPLLLRLHGLLRTLGEDASRLDPLMARVTGARDTSQPADDIFPQIMDDEFDLIDDSLHAPLSSPSAQSIRTEGLIEPGTHTTPSWTARTNPLGFEIQYGVPHDESYAAPPRTQSDE